MLADTSHIWPFSIGAQSCSPCLTGLVSYLSSWVLGWAVLAFEGGCPEWPASFHEPSKLPLIGSYLPLLWIRRSGLKSRTSGWWCLPSSLPLRILNSLISWLLQPSLLFIATFTTSSSLFVNSRSFLQEHHPCLASAVPVLSCYSRQPRKCRLIVSCSVAFPPHVRVIEVAHKNHGLGGKTNFCLLVDQ